MQQQPVTERVVIQLPDIKAASAVMRSVCQLSSPTQLHLQANAAEHKEAEQEGDWHTGAPTDFQPFEASKPGNTSGHHINVVLKPGASQVLPLSTVFTCGPPLRRCTIMYGHALTTVLHARVTANIGCKHDMCNGILGRCAGCVCRPEQQPAGACHGTCPRLALQAVDCGQLGPLTDSQGELL